MEDGGVGNRRKGKADAEKDGKKCESYDTSIANFQTGIQYVSLFFFSLSHIL